MISRPLALFVPAFVAYLTTAAPVDVVAGVPGTLTYQGLLTDQSGTPVTDTLPIAFRLYGSVSAGSPFWSETQTITLIEGRLSAILGANTSGNPLPKEAFTGETYIELQPDANGDGNLTEPRHAHASPTALERGLRIPGCIRGSRPEPDPFRGDCHVERCSQRRPQRLGAVQWPERHARPAGSVHRGGGWGIWRWRDGRESVHTLTVNELLLTTITWILLTR